MSLPKKSIPWKFDPYAPYLPISYKGVEVGFCTPDFAARIVEVLNEDEKLRNALKLACLDLIEQSGGDSSQVDELMNKYLEKSDRPKYGTGAIAFLLRDRQKELDMSDKEFVPFCAAYQLSPEELKDIYQGKDISNSQLRVLTRILGKSIQELTQLRDGPMKAADEDDNLSRTWSRERLQSTEQKRGEDVRKPSVRG